MRQLALGEVIAPHRRVLVESGGRPGVRDLGAIASAVAQPKVSVGGQDACPSLTAKAAALGYSSVRNLASLMETNVSSMSETEGSGSLFPHDRFIEPDPFFRPNGSQGD